MLNSGQACSTVICSNQAAYRTRSQPAWCTECLERILATAMLRPLEPFPGKANSWWLASCLACNESAHFRLLTILDKNRAGEWACRACFWDKWTVGAGRGTAIGAAQLAELVENSGYVSNVTIPPTAFTHDTISLSCVRCGRTGPRLVRDVGFGCDCSKNARTKRPTDDTSAAGQLFQESDSQALAWWDHEANDPRVFATTKTLGRKPVWWRCPECHNSFEARPNDMHSRPVCPRCEELRMSERAMEWERRKRTPVSDVPELRFAWASSVDPSSVMVADHQLYKFRCSEGHLPSISPSRFLDAGCPACRGNATRKKQQMVADVQPELAEQWHPSLNGKHTPSNVVWDSQRLIWWRSGCCGHDWQAAPRDRDKYKRLRCPECRSILGSLAWTDPGLAMEWSPDNPETPWHVRPNATLPYEPAWVCSRNADHQWIASLVSRGGGTECPDCREYGKSRVEMAHHAAAAAVFGNARSGATLKSKAFASRLSWTADISFEHNGRHVVVEYDGAYWHGTESKMLVDQRKTADLLAAGYRVVRLREDGLPPLPLKHDDLLQLNVHSTVPRPDAVMDRVREWLDQSAPEE